MRLVVCSLFCLTLAGCGGGFGLGSLFAREEAPEPANVVQPTPANGSEGQSASQAVGARAPLSTEVGANGLYPGETPQMRALVNEYAARHEIPVELLHRVIQRESDYRADARAGPYYGLMQILPQTARTMGFSGEPNDLLDARTNLEYAGRYLRGAWLVSGGDMDTAIGWYARGYYYEARNRCLLVATGLNDREIAPNCR